MQTFLPYSDVRKTSLCLDYRRLGKQRVEAKQIIDCLEGKGSLAWKNHPAVKMWIGHVDALKYYHDVMIDEWVRRGYKNNMPKLFTGDRIIYPEWFGDEKFHKAHRAALLFKDVFYYKQFGWQEQPVLNYWWPI